MIRLVLLSTIVALAYGSASNFPPLDGRIVGGERTTIEEHPYQASLGYNGGHFCGCALIRPNVVVTAAHCVNSALARYLTVRAGTSKRGKNGKVVKVLKVCQHPDYNPDYDFDVAVLLLAESFELSASIQTISPQSVGKDVRVGAVATVTGWGRLSSGGSLPSDLQRVMVPKISQKSCNEQYPFETITSRMSCYGFPQGGKDACQGDSGGPLVVGGKLVGLVSWGYGCAQPREPGVYTNIADEAISSHIDSCLKSFENLTI